MPEPQSSSTPPRIWTTLDLMRWTRSYFEKKGIENARLESELLLSEALGWPRIRLYADFEKPVGPDELARFREMVKRRGETCEPLQYIVGHTQFIDLKIKVTRAALIPRPETEVLAAWAAERAQKYFSTALDLCTGTGCIALYVATKVPSAKVIATDISPDALALARENANALGLSERIEFFQSDLFAALGDKNVAPLAFDLMTANPPYVDPADKATLQPEVRDHEPALALFSEKGGTAIAERILAECGPWLKPGGWLGMEFGMGQGEKLKTCAEHTGHFEDIALQVDHNKVVRFLTARRRSS